MWALRFLLIVCVVAGSTVASPTAGLNHQRDKSVPRSRRASAPNLCSAVGQKDAEVIYVDDGTENRRCATVVTPEMTSSGPLPVLFFFHGSGGNAHHCGTKPDKDSGLGLAQYADKYGFALVCGEAVQDLYGKGGRWAIPEVMTDETGPRCQDNDTADNVYVRNMVAYLRNRSDVYDTSRLFTSGCSMGSAFSEFSGQCLHEWYGSGNITAFATHSTGLKVKGDNIRFPPDIYNKSVGWGECEHCQYFPAVPKRMVGGLKACLNDNFSDGPFYKSTLQMNERWKSAGNRAEQYLHPGGHCEIHSFWEIVSCLDDGTGRLISNGSTAVSS